ncbi:hypothetical protein [Brevundimonas naejangsanensis]|uniref:hypothetical protein n=1 Tax=Brevundimonas naejangsanensis TaxID=588932 RepID=UPI00106A8F76|nr:hypothetical protein [Brevundimonas naejangsanensis]QBQ49362.1 hypothetical protein E3U41_12085 [Brevundimonas naejangsanensis]
MNSTNAFTAAQVAHIAQAAAHAAYVPCIAPLMASLERVCALVAQGDITEEQLVGLYEAAAETTVRLEWLADSIVETGPAPSDR